MPLVMLVVAMTQRDLSELANMASGGLYATPQHWNASTLDQDLLTDALTGDRQAVYRLWNAIPLVQRGDACWFFFREQYPAPLLALLVELTWLTDPTFFTPRNLLGVRPLRDYEAMRWDLMELFKYCDFPKPDGPLRVWRGTVGLSLEDARHGFSWTTDRAVAASHASRKGERSLIITTKVMPEDVSFFSDRIQEREVVILDSNAVADARIDRGER